MEEQNKPKKPWYLRSWGILLIVFAFFFLVFGSTFAFLVLNISKNPINLPKISKEAIAPEKLKLINGQNNYFIGPKEKAPITIIEFADFACPHCQLSAPILRKLSYKYKDKIKFVFRDFPVISENSFNLALAARCAGEQGFFWLIHDKLFKDQGKNEILDLKAVATNLGVDTAKFNNCFDNIRYKNQIEKDFSDGQTLGVTGTPSFFINGYPVEGDIPENTWEMIVQRILADEN